MNQSQELQQAGRMMLVGRGGTMGAPHWWEKSSRWMGSFRLDRRKKFFIASGEAVAQIARRVCRCPIPGNIQGQVGRDSE